MAFDAQGYRQAALQAGIPTNLIDETIAKKTGVSGWLTGGKTGLSGAFNAVGNVLNLPSYAIGGALNQAQRLFGSKYGQTTDATGLGILEGIKNKRAVFTEAPETLGINPESGLGRAIGFGAELLVPDPIGVGGDVLRFARGAGKAEKGAGLFARGAEKIGGLQDDVANTLLQKSYKLNKTDINKIAEAIGVTKESEKATEVVKYLENLGLRGSTTGGVRKIEKTIEPLQKEYNALVRTGKDVNRLEYANDLIKQANELERFATDPNSRTIAARLRGEAEAQRALYKQGVPFTDEILTNTKTKAFGAAKQSQLSSPFETGLNEQIGRAGAKTLEGYAPGSAEIGTRLRGLRTAEEVIGGRSNTGLGTQLVNAFKPSAAGFGIGAGIGYSQGRNPLESGLIGAGLGIAANNPRVLNMAGKVAGTKLPKVSNAYLKTAINTGAKVAKKIPVTAARTSVIERPQPVKEKSRLVSPLPQSTYEPSISQNGGINYNPYKKRQVKPIWSR